MATVKNPPVVCDKARIFFSEIDGNQVIELHLIETMELGDNSSETEVKAPNGLIGTVQDVGAFPITFQSRIGANGTDQVVWEAYQENRLSFRIEVEFLRGPTQVGPRFQYQPVTVSNVTQSIGNDGNQMRNISCLALTRSTIRS